MKEDSQDFGTNGHVTSMGSCASAEERACCGVTACCTSDETPAQDGTTLVDAKTAAGCDCVD